MAEGVERVGTRSKTPSVEPHLLARAVHVLGTREEAERWLSAPALALDGRRPGDVSGTSAGNEAVLSLLTRLEYGVYT